MSQIPMRVIISAIFIILIAVSIQAQIVTTSPAFPTETDSVTITFDASKGAGGLNNCNCDVYLHTGVITSLSTGNSDWKHVFTTWGVANPAWKLTALGNNLFTYKFAPSLRSAYSVIGSETIQKIALVFRNGDGTKEGKDNGNTDIFVNVYPANSFNVSFTSPSKGAIKNVNDTVVINAASSRRSALALYENGILVSSLPNDSVITFKAVSAAPVNQKYIISATHNGITKYDTLNYTIYGGTPIATLPSGVRPGINYTGASSVTLCLTAPFKNYIYVIGDFTQWNPDATTLMNKTPDGKYFWVTINGLQNNTEYAYQYLIDGNLKVADPLCDKISDPWNDGYIPASIYPNLKPYPAGKTSGIASVFQLGQTPFNWQYSSSFQKPAKENLNIYELLIRDFHSGHSYKSVMDSLGYLKRMGINAIELMPFSEFEGNESWGYNVDFHLAVDKAYGTKNDLKQLIDKCHQQGIAVIMDMVLNHAFGLNPMVQMYFNTSANTVSTQNPWFNTSATHPFNVGYDFNHESFYTRDYVDTVLSYWLQEYHLDGFRFDLSKGFTQKNTGTDVNTWGQYDASRINNLQRMYDKVKTYSPAAYMILEHFAENAEDKELASRGFLLWGNLNYAYNQSSMGYSSGSDLSWGSAKARSFTDNNLVVYIESHDEERLMYKNIQYGNSNTDYNVKALSTSLKRQAAVAAIFYSQPGPKMIWQFGELGYDFSINRCVDGTVNNNCRLDSKPIRWNYLLEPDRYRLYQVFGAMQLLHNNAEFITNNYEWYTTGLVKNAKVNGTNLKVNTIVNFDIVSQIGTPNFQNTGWWHDYLSGDSIQVTNTAMTFNLQPGEYHVYTSKKVTLPAWITTKVGPSGIEQGNSIAELQLYPNPAKNEITISIPSDVTNYEVIDVLGQILLKGNLQNHKTTLDISTLSSGVYFVVGGGYQLKFIKD